MLFFRRLHGFNFVKKESIIKSKIFRRFYNFDYLIAINGAVNNIVSYIFDLMFRFFFRSVQLFYFIFSRKPKYAAPPVSAFY